MNDEERRQLEEQLRTARKELADLRRTTTAARAMLVKLENSVTPSVLAIREAVRILQDY